MRLRLESDRRREYRASRWVGAALLALAVGGVLAPVARALPGEDDQTPGLLALGFARRSNVWSHLELGVIDGRAKTSPPDTTRYDRSLVAAANAGFDWAMTSRLALRVDVEAEGAKRRQAENDAGNALIDMSSGSVSPSLDLTFITDKGLEIFGGAMRRDVRPKVETVTTPSGTSRTAYDAAILVSRRFGVVRRASAWSGGFYYEMGDEQSRGAHAKALDGSVVSTTDTVFVPARVGVFGAFKTAMLLWDFELDFIQARGLGPRDENGNTAYTDYFAARLSSYVPLNSEFGLRLTTRHQTLSYASDAFVSLDSIPVTSLETLLVMGKPGDESFVGFAFAYGSDGQSLPEFNAHYELAALAVTAGYRWPLSSE